MSLALTALLVFCLIAWGFVLVPPAVRLLSGVVRPSDSIGSFRTKMTVLGGTHHETDLIQSASTPLTSASPPNSGVLDLRAHRAVRMDVSDAARQRRAAKQRRRNIFNGLLGATPVTFLLAVAVGGPAWALFALTLFAFAGYTALLMQMQQNAREQSRKVAFLPSTASQAPASASLRRISVVGR